VELIYEAEGWISFGSSPQGTMPGGEVVIAKPDEPLSDQNPAKYVMSGRSDAAIALADSQTLLNASYEQSNGQTILRFTKLLSEPGETEILLNGPNTFIFAAGSDNAFGYHGNARGAITLPQLSQCLVIGRAGGAGAVVPKQQNNDDALQNIVVKSEEAPFKTVWIFHGVLMAISWAILLPIGIGCSLVRKLLPGTKVWFQLHMFCNGTAFLLMTAAFGLAVYAVEQSGATHFSSTRHQTIGLAIYVLSFVQVVSGIFRPHLPPQLPSNSTKIMEEGEQAGHHQHDLEASSPPIKPNPLEQQQQDTNTTNHPTKKSFARILFELGHRIFGFGLLGLSWYNLYTGILLLTAYYGATYNKIAILWAVIGCVSGLILILYLYQAVMFGIIRKM
jgi:Eukaryotic cytochrome b561